jgi:hypothetical protein
MTRRTRLAGFLVFGLLAAGLTAGASPITVVFDDFDDGALAPAWTVGLENATGWTFVETGSLLTVTDIAATVINSGNGGTSARVILSQSFTPLSDFTAAAQVAWDSAGSLSAMQAVGIHLFDSANTLVAGVEYGDGWVGYAGARVWAFGSVRSHSGAGSLPLAGTAALGISRVGSTIDFTWDASTLFTHTSTAAIDRVDLIFWHYGYDGPQGVSFFATESIDSVSIEGTPIAVPEPSTLLLVGSGVAAVVGMRLGRRNRGS